MRCRYFSSNGLAKKFHDPLFNVRPISVLSTWVYPAIRFKLVADDFSTVEESQAQNKPSGPAWIMEQDNFFVPRRYQINNTRVDQEVKLLLRSLAEDGFQKNPFLNISGKSKGDQSVWGLFIRQGHSDGSNQFIHGQGSSPEWVLHEQHVPPWGTLG